MNTASDSTDLNIGKNEYVAFDAVSLKDFIRTKLSNSGLFTDQAYEGSNLNAINNIISYSFHTLMYYMNQTATESMFNEAQLYENINRIVKQLNYSPVGAQAPTLSFAVSATSQLGTGTYTIPRYTFIRAGNAPYSFNTDVTFTKTVTGLQVLTEVGNQYLLYQGKYIEYPLYTARGESNEIVFIIPGNNNIIDHFNIDVYVKDIDTGLWSQWSRTESLYLENATAAKFEIRLNENKNYEIKFGDDINGRQLKLNDIIAVYYLETLGAAGEVGTGAINGRQAALYNTIQFNQIAANVISSDLTLLTDVNITYLNYTNDNLSTSYTPIESVDSIRKYAPASFKSQFRLVTPNDFVSYIKSAFANIINDVKVYNNNSYITNHIKYLYDIGLTNPGSDYRVLYNQVNFADSCNFNNVYVYALPKATKLLNVNYVSYLTPAQKQLIISNVEDKKMLTSQVVIMDPVYKAVSIGTQYQQLTLTDVASSTLVVALNDNAKVVPSVIKDKVRTILTTYFDPVSAVLGSTVNPNELTNQILSIDGVKTVTTENNGAVTNGVSLIVWNPSYPEQDITVTTKTFTLSDFQTIYLDRIEEIMARVVILPGLSQTTSIINF
jgi:DNA-dependent RNA polymerase auxiliary subunit epsilon